MSTQITALILDDEIISINRIKFSGKNEVIEAFSSALQSDPNFILVVGQRKMSFIKASVP